MPNNVFTLIKLSGNLEQLTILFITNLGGYWYMIRSFQDSFLNLSKNRSINFKLVKIQNHYLQSCTAFLRQTIGKHFYPPSKVVDLAAAQFLEIFEIFAYEIACKLGKM